LTLIVVWHEGEKEESPKKRSKSMTKEKEKRDSEKKEKARRKREKSGKEKKRTSKDKNFVLRNEALEIMQQHPAEDGAFRMTRAVDGSLGGSLDSKNGPTSQIGTGLPEKTGGWPAQRGNRVEKTSTVVDVRPEEWKRWRKLMISYFEDCSLKRLHKLFISSLNLSLS
jgi:hypothetical protein